MNTYKIIISCAICSAVFVNANAASFDCAKAKGKVEKTICSDTSLSKLDEQLLVAYKSSLVTHPLPEYVRARQRDWLSLNKFCDASKFTSCLTKNYEERISHLKGINSLKVYSNTKKFNYENGDAVAEYWLNNGVWRFSVWGGFVIHKVASNDNGKPTYVGCEFEGTMSKPTDQHATGVDGSRIEFKMDSARLVFKEGTEICSGFGRLPDLLESVSKDRL